ncbi:Cytochrome c551 peroxidase precursor [compost metagenome]|uniref:Cytochrome-c peroxidase n=1 Tax=Serratia liquefaciens TaxID=614 RepID=A0ABX7CYT0_SERLI|nr:MULTISPECIES: cytochrome-c peroxidase [Serratia]AYO37579.1 cytochrome-c peroxidase [Serratia sp. P2ACOL2]MBI6161241.1 cytochrome-c peroxidase [Serratia liquefaciens]QQU53459.1 cytochrome-c peroxidase [Serratia liquefaciens]CAI2447434.1 Cytochrome c551 peroxidase precursor [Serratia liquefaciens]
MKKVTRIAAMSLTGIVLCYLGLSGYVWYHDTQRTVYSQAPRSALEKNNQILGLLREKGCDYCHTPSADLPFYASFPIAKQLMEYDIRLGYQSFNLEPVRASLIEDKAVSQSDLNKIEWVMQHKTMPPTRYVALHWAGQVDEQERETLLGWIAQQRARYYASNEAAAEHRNEPIQPIPKALPVDAQKVALGFRLYHDPRLSGDSTLSCAHCHSLNTGGVDGRKTSIGVGGAVGPINAPTVFNSVFNSEQFWDGRAPTLQVQAGGPPLNPIEMASKSWEEIIGKLDKDPVLTRDFVAAYPQGLSGETITDAIAEFEKTLITPDSPFDNWLRGDDNAMTMQQKHGYQLFKDNKCATCHGGTILGGRSFEPLGLKRDFNFGEITAADIGRMNVTSEARDRLRQKVPGLRNVALTAPYFHRGDVATLDEAVKLMLRYQVGTELPQQDVDDIVAFLESLTGVYTPYTQSQK